MKFSKLFGPRSFILWDADTGGSGGGIAQTQIPDNTNGDGTGGGEEKKSYTQKELDAIFGERARHAKQSGVAELLKELGVESIDAIKTTLSEAEKAKKAQMTELEKAQAEAADLKTKVEAAEAARLDTEAKAAEKLLRAAVLSAATAAGFHNPADAWLYIDRTGVKPKDDDSYEGIDKAIEAVTKARPYLVKTQQTTPAKGTPARTQHKPQPAPPELPTQAPVSTVNF